MLCLHRFKKTALASAAILCGIAPALRADNVTAYLGANSGDIIGINSSGSGSTRLTAEGTDAANFAAFSVMDFTKSSFGLNFTATSFSNLMLNLTDRAPTDGFAKPGMFDIYYTLDTSTNAYVGSTLRYTGSVANGYQQGLTTDGTATGPSQFTSAPVLLSTQMYTPGTNSSTVNSFSLAGVPSSYFLDVLNGTNGATALRLIIAPREAGTAANFYGYNTANGPGGSYRPNLTFSATLNQPTLAWKGGGGTWLPAGSSGDTSWNGGPWASSNIAQFGGTAGTVTLGGAISAAGVQFDSSGYTVAGTDHLTLTGGATAQVTNAADTATISAPISGSAGLTKIGAGALVLTNAANDYVGTTTITSGALVISADHQLGATGNAVALNGGALRTAAPVTLAATRALGGSGMLDLAGGALTTSGSVSVGALTVTGGTANFNAAAAFTSADVTATGRLNLNGGINSAARSVLSGDGTVALSGDNSGYGLGLTVSKGTGQVGPTLIMGSATSLGGGQTNLNAGTLVSASDISIGNVVSLGGSATVGGTASGTTGAIAFTGGFGFFGSGKKVLTINVTTTIATGITAGTGTSPNNSLNKAGLGTLILTSLSNSYDGGTTVTAGRLQVAGNGALGTGSVAVTALATAHVVLEIDNNEAIDNLSDIILTSNGAFHGQLDLEFSASGLPEVVRSLLIDGVPITPGTYPAGSFPGIVLGTGRLTVTQLATVPEPSTWALLGCGLAAAVAGRRRAGTKDR